MIRELPIAVNQTTALDTPSLLLRARAGDAPAVKLLLEHGETIRNRLQAIAASEAVDRIQAANRDEEFLTKIFGAAYDCLPRPVCRFVTEAQFTEFCRRHHRRWLAPTVPEPPQLKPQNPSPS